MENMDLSNAEVAVTTQHILDGKEYKDYWVQMSDYSDMGEFLCACSDLFPEEEDPEYRYARWENIPDRLINREWICPNFFEIRDAIERLDENEREYFVTWSEHFGYDITTDNPHMMVAHYLDIYGNTIQETYPKYKFSVSRHNYDSIHIYLVKADFEAFKKDKGVVFHHDVNHYHIDNDDTLTDRAKEVMKNVCDFVMSYNFDDSDPMTDYFCTNFYLTLGVGTYKKPYKVELPKLNCKGKKPDVFKYPEGAAHKAIHQALGGAYFSFHNSQRLQGKMVLGEDSYGHSGDKYFWPLSYSSAKTAQKRIDKLEKAGIRCKLTGYNGGCIEFLGYTPETEALLEKERQDVIIAHREWQAKQVQTA